MTGVESALAKLNLYDQVGYLAVGGLFMMVARVDLAILGIPIADLPVPTEIGGRVLLVYFLGHFAQTIANYIVKENKTAFSTKHLAVLKAVARKIKMKPFDPNEAYQTCYMLALANDPTGHVQVFNANYSLYRGWASVFLMNSVFFATLVTLAPLDPGFWAAMGSSAILSTIMQVRAVRMYSYGRSKTLQTYSLFAKK